MGVEDEMIECCSMSSLTLNDTESKDTNMSESNWDSRLIKTALLDTNITCQPQSFSPAKEDGGYMRGKMRMIVEVSKHKYNDDIIKISDDSDGDLIFPTFEVESSSDDDIFKVWDLECSFGENEQLFKKPLSASFIQTNQHRSDVGLGSNEHSINHLTVGVADLSLNNQGFGRLGRLTSGIADMSLDQNSGSKLPS